MNLIRISPASGLLFFFVLTGCAGVGTQLEPPRISLANIRVQEFTGFETVFQIQLRVINTNDVDLQVKGIEAELEINGQPFAAGVSSTAVEIPTYGTELVPLILYSSVINIIKSISGLHESEQLEYYLIGKLRLAGENMLPATLPFEAEGQVTIGGLNVPEK